MMMQWLAVVLGLLLTLNGAVVPSIEAPPAVAKASDAFYIGEALKLTEQAGQLAASQVYMELFSTNAESLAFASTIGEGDYSLPIQGHVLALEPSVLLDFWDEDWRLLEKKLQSEPEIIRTVLYQRVSTAITNLFFNMGNLSTSQLVALTTLGASESYRMPVGFSQSVLVVLTYDTIFSMTTFVQTGEDIISATTRFVIPPDDPGDFAKLVSLLNLLDGTRYTGEELLAATQADY